MSPYRTRIDDDAPRDEPPIDPAAHRVLSWLGGGFHLLGALGLVAGTWLLALTGTSIMAYTSAIDPRPARFDATPLVAAGMTITALVLAHAARVVANDVWDGRRIVRCRIACLLAIALGGPFGSVVGVGGLVVLAMPRFRRLFTS